ncbi:MAG: cell division protein FtsW [Chitinophagales bacterium]|nr:cell division protein FtsW [Bacteroidota bacterium]MBP9221765.1 cell division protein FtsW [Chitinophagales bacterium]
MSQPVTYMLSKVKGDRYIWLVVFVLSVFSILAVYSSTETLAYKSAGGNTEYYLIKHTTILIFGIFLMYLSHLIPFKYYSRIAQILLWISVPALLYTMFLAPEVNDASRWITLPVINLTFQTSDLARFALIMYTARILSKTQDKVDSFKEAFVPVILPIAIICALILPENLSTASVLFFTCIVLMFVGRVNFKYIMLTIGAGIVLLGIVIGLSYLLPDVGRLGTWNTRVESFINGGDDNEEFQVEQAKIAIAQGGILGVGPGNSTQKDILPYPYADFIFATIIEEYGLFGAVVFIFLYLVLLYRCIKIVIKAPSSFGALLAVGLGLCLTIQAFANMAVAVHLVPTTGLTLPLVSMGGTSLWFTSLSIGIILSVSREIEVKEEKDSAKAEEEEDVILEGE